MKYKFSMGLIILITVLFSKTQAQTEENVKQDARHCISRTGLVLVETQKAVKQGKIYTGYLSRAVAHQRFAKKQFSEGHYLNAIQQSIYSRNLAFVALQSNKAAIDVKWRNDELEMKYEKNLPSDKELDSQLPGYNSQTDQDLINSDINDVNMDEKEKQ